MPETDPKQPVVIEAGVVWSRFVGEYPVHDASRAASCYAENFQFHPKFRQRSRKTGRRLWDGRKRFLDRRNGTFPTGLAVHVMQKLLDEGHQVSIDTTKLKEACPTLGPLDHSRWTLEGVTLRDYQDESVCRFMLAPLGRGVLEAATGSGKTEIAAAVIKHVGVPTLFICKGKDLLYQTVERLKLRLPRWPVGIVGAGVWNPQAITVASIDTLNSRFKREDPACLVLLRDSKLLINDEAHHVPADSWYRMVMACQAPLRLGMSGTPFRSSEERSMLLMASTGGLIYRVRNKDLIERGILARPMITMIEVDKDCPKHHNGDWTQAYEDLIVNSERRNGTIVRKAREFVNRGLRVLILVRKVKHGRNLERLLRGAGVRMQCRFLHGSDHVAIRRQAVQLFRTGQLRCIIASSIFDEGIDVPEIDALIVAAAGKSSVKTMQRLGRGMRQKQGENVIYVVDFADYGNIYLLKHSIQRLKDYESEEAFVIDTEIAA